jgi:hypothetical protein
LKPSDRVGSIVEDSNKRTNYSSRDWLPVLAAGLFLAIHFRMLKVEEVVFPMAAGNAIQKNGGQTQ